MNAKVYKAFIYRMIDGERLLVDVRNITGYTVERFHRFYKEMEAAGREIEVVADPIR